MSNLSKEVVFKKNNEIIEKNLSNNLIKDDLKTAEFLEQRTDSCSPLSSKQIKNKNEGCNQNIFLQSNKTKPISTLVQFSTVSDSMVQNLSNLEVNERSSQCSPFRSKALPISNIATQTLPDVESKNVESYDAQHFLTDQSEIIKELKNQVEILSVQNHLLTNINEDQTRTICDMANNVMVCFNQLKKLIKNTYLN